MCHGLNHSRRQTGTDDRESDSELDIKTAVATRNAQICLESAGFSVTENFMYRSMTIDIHYDIVILHYFYDSFPELRASCSLAEGLLGCRI